MSRVQWIKVAIGMFDDEKIKLIDAMVERDVIHYVWLRLLIQAGKTNEKGDIFLNENTPYTKEMLSIIFNRPVETIEFALKTLMSLGMIEVDDDNFINISNWEKHQNVEGMERVREQNRERVRKCRKKKKEEEGKSKENIDEENNDFTSSNGGNDLRDNDEGDNEEENFFEKNCNVTVMEQREKKIKNKNKKEIKRQTEKENNRVCQADAEEEFDDNKSLEIKQETNEVDLMSYVKKMPKKILGISLSAIKRAISIHGEENVKFAIDKALEVNKPRMNYINGILENWQREGYPMAEINASNNCSGYEFNKFKHLSFNNFQPRHYDYEKLEKELLGW